MITLQRLLVLATLGLTQLSTQVNPPSVPASPAQVAVFDASGGGSTVCVEFRNSTGATVPMADSAGTIWSAATVTVASSSATGLGYAITQTAPDGTHNLVGVPKSAVKAILRCATGQITANMAGTYDSSVGSGQGIATNNAAPSAASPILVYSGDWIVMGGQQ